MTSEARPVVKARLEDSIGADIDIVKSLKGQAVISGLVASGGIISQQFDLDRYTHIGLVIPTITSSTITFMVAATSGLTSGTGAIDLKNSSGVTLSIPAATGNFAIADVTLKEALAPWRYVRIIVDAQVDGRHFKFVTKA